MREIARTYVRMFVEWGRRVLADAGAATEQLARAQDMTARLQPAAARALLAAFRTEMAAAVEEAVETVIGRLAEGEAAEC